VGSHFTRPEVSRQIIDQHGGRLAHLPPGARALYLVVDIRQSGQTIGEALTYLSRVMRNYGRLGDARGLWNGSRQRADSVKRLRDPVAGWPLAAPRPHRVIKAYSETVRPAA
jgi:hypothetical protein